MRPPTRKQYDKLLALGSGAAGLSWTKGDVQSLMGRGWVTAEFDEPYYQWVRITPDGLRALAAAVERWGLPDMKAKRAEREIDATPPRHKRLMEERDAARKERDELRRELWRHERAIARIHRETAAFPRNARDGDAMSEPTEREWLEGLREEDRHGPDCTCDGRPPRRADAIARPMIGKYRIFLSYVEDTRFDPACPLHGDNGTMVASVPVTAASRQTER